MSEKVGVYGACGIEGCKDCTPSFDENDNEISVVSDDS